MEWRGYVLSSLHNLIEGITWSTSSLPYYGGTKTRGGTSLLSYYEGKKDMKGGTFFPPYVRSRNERTQPYNRKCYDNIISSNSGIHGGRDGGVGTKSKSMMASVDRCRCQVDDGVC